MNHDLSGLPDPELDTQFYSGVVIKRFIAWIIDFVIITAIWTATIVFSLGFAAFFAFFIYVVINFAYRAIMLDKYSATLGMKLVGIEIRNANGYKLDRSQACWHVGMYMFMVMFFIINVISMAMMLFSPRGQGLHDYFLGTAAINKPLDG